MPEDDPLDDENPDLGPADWKPLIPFLDQDPKYCYGVEFGMWYQACRTKPEHGQMVRTENESQMTLTCSRLGWEVADCRPWDAGPPDNGWIYLKVRNPNTVEAEVL